MCIHYLRGCASQRVLSCIYCCYIKSIYHKDDKTECAICLSPIHRGVQMSCLHEYHHDCIYKWNLIKNECPLCRRSLVHMRMKSNKIEFD